MCQEKSRTKSIFWTVLPIFMSAIALYYSFKANDISEKVRSDNRLIHNLDLEPDIKLRIFPLQNRSYPLNIEIKNYGPVAATQVKIKFYEMGYSDKKKRIGEVRSGGDITWQIDQLKPDELIRIEAPQRWTNTEEILKMASHYNIPPFYFALKGVMTYQKEPDKKQFGKIVFYFYDSEGYLLQEARVIGEKRYKKILSAVMDETSIFEYSEDSKQFRWDILHDMN